jgi:hypothetical protein
MAHDLGICCDVDCVAALYRDAHQRDDVQLVDHSPRGRGESAGSGVVTWRVPQNTYSLECKTSSVYATSCCMKNLLLTDFDEL